MSEMKPISIDMATFVRLAMVVLIAYLAYLLFDFLIIIILSLIFATAIKPGRQFLERLKIPASVAVIIIYIVIGIIFSLLTYTAIPILVEQATLFSVQIDSLINSFNTFLATSTLTSYLGNIDFALLDEKFAEITGNLITTISQGATKIIGGIINFVLFLLLTFFFSVKEQGTTDFIKTISPLKYRSYILDLWSRSKTKIGRWVQGQLLLALIIGVLVFIGLTVIGIPNALFLAVFAAVFELIPLIGPVISAIPAILVALSEVGLTGALIVLVFFIAIQQLENNLIYPIVVTKVVGIPTIAVILALVTGAILIGFIGVVIAIPIAAILLEFFKDIRLGRIKDFVDEGTNYKKQAH